MEGETVGSDQPGRGLASVTVTVTFIEISLGVHASACAYIIYILIRL